MKDTAIYKEYLQSIFNSTLADINRDIANSNASNFLLPITYITPNYLSISSMATAASLSNLNKKVTILLHDNNLLVHNYFIEQMKKTNLIAFNKAIENIEDEMMLLLNIFKADISNIIIMRSSDLWLKTFGNKESFLNFYRLLGKISTKENPNIHINKTPINANYTLQAVLDIYFALNSDLFPKTMLPIESIILAERRFSYYKQIMEILISDYGYKHNLYKPAIYVYKKNKPLMVNDILPSCYSSKKEIKYIIEESKFTKNDLIEFNKNYLTPIFVLLKKLNILSPHCKLYPKQNKTSLIENMYSVLTSLSEKLRIQNEAKLNNLIIDSNAKLLELRHIIGSQLIYKILENCNGNMTNTDIAKKLNIQISNTSKYINMLRASGLLTSDKRPRIKASKIIINLDEILFR